MEENKEEQINNIFDILKSMNDNNKFLDKNNMNNLFNDKKEEKKYLKLKFEKIYIINREPIEELMNKLHFNEFENLLNKKEDDYDEDEIKEKIEKYIEDDSSINIDIYLDKIEFYNTQDKIDEIVNQNIKALFVEEKFLLNLGMKKTKLKNKEILFAKRKDFIIFYFIKENFSIMINLALISDKISNINSIKTKKENNESKDEDEDEGNDKSADEIQDIIEKNNFTLKLVDKNIKNDNIINEIDNENNNKINNLNNEVNNNFNNNISNEEEFQNELNKNFNLFSYHINYINSINQLSSIYINDLNDINQIKNLLFYQNKMQLILNCYLVKSEVFENLEKKIYYEDLEYLYNIEDQKEKDQKIKELIGKMKKEKKDHNDNLNNKLEIINDYQECYNIIKNNPETQFMFIDDNFYFSVCNNKTEEQSNISLFKMNEGLFIYFKDKDKIMKVFNMNKYFKLNINIEDIIDVPNNVVDDLVILYEQTKHINELIDEEMKEHSSSDYYVINKNWLKEFKQYYNFEEITIQYEQQAYEYEEVDEEQNFNINNNNQNSENKNNNEIVGLNFNKKKKKKKRRKYKRNKNNYNKINEDKNDIKKDNKKPKIKVQYMNKDYPKLLLNDKNILPNFKSFKNNSYPIDFELIEIQTLNNLCNHLKIKISIEVLNQITFSALLGDKKLILQRKLNENLFTVFNSIGINNDLEYIIIFDNNNLVSNEINIIKRKGIEKYLSDMQLNFDDDSLQYLINESCNTTIGKVYIIKKIVNNNINNYNPNINYNANNTIINNILNYNYEFSNKIDKIPPRRLGLDNIGATCYMNATLQCLCNIIQLQNYFLNNQTIFQKNGARLSKAFCEVLQNLYDYKKNKNSYQPHNFKNTISDMNSLFKGIAANDSKDLILFIYEKIHEELNEPKNYYNLEQNISYELQLFRQNYYSNNSSIIEKTFYYEQQTINECSNCHNKVINYNIQNMLIFPLEKIRLNLIEKTLHGYEFPCVYLEQCFEHISIPELMQRENNIYCNNCHQYSNSYYTSKMNTSPEIFTIILNRGKGNEFDVEFDFPLRIDINNYVISKNKCTIYDLIGVLVHTGGSNMSGHFFAFCKSNIDHNWYKYNDGIVQMCNYKDYEYEIKHTGLPYVLFYQNVDSLNIMNNSSDKVSLYFRTKDEIEIYFDANKNELFSNVIQRLAQNYSNCKFNFFNANYFLITFKGKQNIDYNKTINENNLSNYSYIFIE